MSEDHQKSIEELLRYYGRVVSFLKSLGFPHQEALDLTQDVYSRVYEHWSDYRGEAKWSYLEQIARRLAMNSVRDRKAAKRDGIHVSEEKLIDVADENVRPADDELQSQLEARRLYDAIEHLEPKFRTAILMQLGGLSYEEIAKTLGITLSALKTRLHVARIRLKEMLQSDVNMPGGEE